ncbi:GntR family transcriptional regulator [Rhodospirillum sp. A1_3_36]|uniref:GntR family transcriptional regulator n=1 Tax=Rhodospirillum sp. A1_3_36 TaxID=3391666 RepID=UPI0039A67F27
MLLKVDKPLPVRIQEAVRQLIRDEGLQPGDQLPTENDLIQRLGVGRSSLREALANLTSEGILRKVQGRGTFVRHLPIVMKHGLQDLQSVTEHIQAVGAEPSTSRMLVKTFPAGASLAEKLQVGEEEECVWVERVRRADDALAAYCVDIFPRAILGDILETRDLGDSLFGMLHEVGREVSYTESTLTPAILTRRDLPEMAEQVGLFMLFEEIFYDVNGVPVCYSNDYYSSEIFDFRISRKRRF